jgi:hypothetical protein
MAGLTSIVLRSQIADKRNRIEVEVGWPPCFRTLSPAVFKISNPVALDLDE